MRSESVHADVTSASALTVHCTALLPGPRGCRSCMGRGGQLGLKAGPVSFGFIVEVGCKDCDGRGEVCRDCGRPYVYDGLNKDSCQGRLAR